MYIESRINLRTGLSIYLRYIVEGKDLYNGNFGINRGDSLVVQGCHTLREFRETQRIFKFKKISGKFREF